LGDGHGGVPSDDDDPGDHQRECHDLAHDPGRRAVQLLVQEYGGEEDGDERVGRGDDGQDRRDQVTALLEGALVQQEAHRADHGQGVDRPGGQQVMDPVPGHDLDQEGRDAVADAGGQRERERLYLLVPLGHEHRAPHEHHERHREREQDESADGRLAARRVADDQEAGHPDRAHGGADEDDRVALVP
jgi:hypothetical protein